MRILCIGDSNTWGFIPGSGQRHKNRWTRILAERQPEWEIVEEGYSGRTLTAPDYEQRQRCGMESLKMLLMSHRPLDCVVIMLGTNDLKRRYHVSAGDLAEGLREYLRTILNPFQWEGSVVPKVLVASPILVGEDLGRREEPYGSWDENSVIQSRGMAGAMEAVCREYGVGFLDGAKYASASDIDCIHMDEENHRSLGLAVEEKLREILL